MKKLKIIFIILSLIQSHIIYTANNACSPCNFEDNFSDCAGCFGASSFSGCTIPCGPKTYFQPRSQGSNTAREMVGWQDKINLYNVCSNYLSTAFVFEFQKSFKDFRLSREYFGDEVLSFVGSQVPDRVINLDAPFCNFLADNFGLSPIFNGTIKLCPEIENIILDFEFFWGLDKWIEGLYLRFHAPLTSTRWKLSSCEDLCLTFSPQLPACYFSDSVVQPFTSIAQSLKGSGFGDVPARQFGKFPFGTHSKFGFADIDLILGYNICNSEFSHIGIYAQAVVPTGNKPNPKFIFSPVLGNGKHWELGIGFSAAMRLWESGAEQNLGIYAEGNITHLFENTQLRSFDLTARGPFSRYLILKEFEDDGVTYKGLVNAIDVTTMPARVKIALKADISAELLYHYNNLGLEFGLNIYGNTRESICLSKKDSILNKRKFGIKGTQGICCQEFNTNAGIIGAATGTHNSLNSTENNSTICNPGQIDNPSSVTSTPGTICVAWDNAATTGDLVSSAIIAQDSNPPLLLSFCDINPCSGASCQNLTYKIFGNISYTWFESDYLPHIGIGAEIEIDGRASNNKGSDFWGIWIKGGVTF
ncbi:hypothetical protein M1446_01440 [Candidatus Dependentiae bacterium]|nr:hypothetical protein [Candidatus Dependentiae bacterium]